VVGDWILIKATVVEKGVDAGGHHYVRIEQEARNQHDELSATGNGIVRLPARG
jgi:hypothetical protein